jgi:hypothetical protein
MVGYGGLKRDYRESIDTPCHTGLAKHHSPFIHLCIYVDSFINYQHLNLGCPAICSSVFRSELFKSVVIYNLFTYVNIMFFTVSKTVQHITYCKIKVYFVF